MRNLHLVVTISCVLVSLCGNASAQSLVVGTVSDAITGDPITGIGVMILQVNSDGTKKQPNIVPRPVGETDKDGKYSIAVPERLSGPIAIQFYEITTRTGGSYIHANFDALSSSFSLTINPALYTSSTAPPSVLQTSTRSLSQIAGHLVQDHRFNLNDALFQLVARQAGGKPDEVRFGEELNTLLLMSETPRTRLSGFGPKGWAISDNGVNEFTWPVADGSAVLACNLGPRRSEKLDWLLPSGSGPVLIASLDHGSGVDSEFTSFDHSLTNVYWSHVFRDLMLAATASSGTTEFTSAGTAKGNILVLKTGTKESIAELELGLSPVTATSLHEHDKVLKVVGVTVDGRLKIWQATHVTDGELSGFQPLHELKIDRTFARAVHFAERGSVVLVGSGIGSKHCALSLIDLSDGRVEITETESPVIDLGMNKEGSIITVGEDGTLASWTVDENRRIHKDMTLAGLGVESATSAPLKDGAIIKLKRSSTPIFIPLDGFDAEKLKIRIQELKE